VYYRSAWRWADLHQGHSGHEDQCAGDQGLVENLNLVQSVGARSPSRWRCTVGCLERRRGSRLQDTVKACARSRHLPELHPDRCQCRVRHQDAGGPQGQAHFGRGATLGHGAQRPGDLESRRPHYKDFAKVEYLPFGESVELIKTPTRRDAAIGRSASRRSRSGDFDQDQRGLGSVEIASKITDPAYLPASIPANTTPDRPKPYRRS